MKEKLIQLKNDITNGTSYSISHVLSEDIQTSLSKKGIKIRKIFAPLLRAIYLTQTKYKLIREKNIETRITKPGKIFVVNHRQADDIVLGANAIGESGYIVFGNKNLALNTTNGLGLWAYGLILLDRENIRDRNATYNKMKYVLNNGGNIIIYPEGYWNLADNGQSDERHLADDHNSENWLIQDINIGVIRLAQETGCPIIPTILHYDEIDCKKCYSQKGKRFFVLKTDDIFQKKDELVEIMTTMYYMLMEKHSNYNREEIEKTIDLRTQWEELKKELISDCDIENIGYRLDLADEKKIGKAKVVRKITTNEEAFEHLQHLNVNKNNAFLLSKRLSGKR